MILGDSFSEAFYDKKRTGYLCQGYVVSTSATWKSTMLRNIGFLKDQLYEDHIIWQPIISLAPLFFLES